MFSRASERIVFSLPATDEWSARTAGEVAVEISYDPDAGIHRIQVGCKRPNQGAELDFVNQDLLIDELERWVKAQPVPLTLQSFEKAGFTILERTSTGAASSRGLFRSSDV